MNNYLREDRVKVLATWLHEQFCGSSHTDMCSWHLRDDWDAIARRYWLAKADELIKVMDMEKEKDMKGLNGGFPVVKGLVGYVDGKPLETGKEEPAKPVNPMQPLYVDDYGRVRFKGNGIVRYLLDNGELDLNKLAVACGGESVEDWEQFYQLIGYSLGGYGELHRVSDKSYEKAERLADRLREKSEKEVVCSVCGGTGQDDPPPGKYHGLCGSCKGTGKIKENKL